MAYLAIGLGVLYWVLDAAVHPLFFYKSSFNAPVFMEQVLAPDIHEIILRSLVLFILVVFGYYAQITTIKSKQAEKGLQESEERYRRLAENARDLMYRVRVSPTLEFEYLSPAIKEIGYAPEELYADPSLAFRIVHPDDRTDFEAALHSPTLFRDSLVLRWKRKDGTPIWAEMCSVPIFDEMGNLIAIEGIARDITEHKKAEEILKHRLMVEKAVSQVASVLVSNETLDNNEFLSILGQAVEASRAYVFYFKGDGKEIGDFYEWCSCGTESQIDSLQNRVKECGKFSWWIDRLLRNENIIIPNVSDLPDEAANERKALQAIGVYSLLAVPMFCAGELLGLLVFEDTDRTREWSEEDIQQLRAVSEILVAYTQRQRSEEQIRYLGSHDKLTTLYNRAYFEHELARINTEEYLPLSLIMGDVNGLKLLNDAFGHQAGDKLLTQASQILEASCDNNAIIARWGGDEFAVILPDTSQQGALEVCERIRRACAEADEDPVRPSIALGVATKEELTQNIGEVLKEAEDRMYRNKLRENKHTRRSIISSLQKTLEERTHETEDHARRLQSYALEMGCVLKLSDSQLDELALLAVLHDIGKIGIPDDILMKPSSLSPEEWTVMKKHPEIGYRIAQTSYELAQIAEAILTHHEHWDGTGYPQGLKDNEIPLISRIMAIVEAYDVMTNDRPYKKAIAHQEALRELKKGAGAQFDPHLVEVFISYKPITSAS